MLHLPERHLTWTALAFILLMAFPSILAAQVDSPITMEELAKHNTADSLYVSIFDIVYDFTEFAKNTNHGGGPEVLMAVAGKNATSEFLNGGHAAPIPENVKAGTAPKVASTIRYVGKLAASDTSLTPVNNVESPALSSSTDIPSSSSTSSSSSSTSSPTGQSTLSITKEVIHTVTGDDDNDDDTPAHHEKAKTDRDGNIIDYVTVTKAVKTRWVTSTTSMPTILTTTTVVTSTSTILSTTTAPAIASMR